MSDSLFSIREKLAKSVAEGKIKIIKQTKLWAEAHDWTPEQLRILYQDHRCPECGSLLKYPIGGHLKEYAVCWGKRHGDRRLFMIRKSKLFNARNPRNTDGSEGS